MASMRGARVVGRDGRRDEPDDLCRLMVDEITWYMRQHKVSRADLSHALNVSPGRVSQILSGDENLTLRTLSGVLDALGARVELTLRSPDEPADLLDELEEHDELLESIKVAAPLP